MGLGNHVEGELGLGETGMTAKREAHSHQRKSRVSVGSGFEKFGFCGMKVETLVFEVC